MRSKNPYYDAMVEALKEALESCVAAERLAKATGKEIRFTSADITRFGLAVFRAKMKGKHA